jgi:ADP-ribose pyrophosphatase
MFYSQRMSTAKRAKPAKANHIAKSSSAKASSAKANPAKASTTEKQNGIKRLTGKAQLKSQRTVYQGKVFWVTRDEVAEPGGVAATRDVIRHNGSVVILAVDAKTNPADPGILLIRQYRHAAGQFLMELPAGRIEPGEKLIPAARRELIEETGYRAKRWSRHVKYFASPGFLTEAMNILLAEDLTLGKATPEDDERIELCMTPLSEVMRMIHRGQIHDGKTLIGVLYYASLHDAHAPDASN